MVFSRSQKVSGQSFERFCGFRIQTVADARAIHAALNPTGVLEDLQVLRNGALRERQDADDFAADAGAALAEQAHDGDARGMAQGLGEADEGFVVGGVWLLHRLSTIGDLETWSKSFT